MMLGVGGDKTGLVCFVLEGGLPPAVKRPMLRLLPVSWAPTRCSSAHQRQGSHISVCVQSLSVIINWRLPTLVLLWRLSKGDHCYSRQLRCGKRGVFQDPAFGRGFMVVMLGQVRSGDWC